MPYATRTRALRNWGFSCTCSLCSSTVDERQASDERRNHIATLLDVIGSNQEQFNEYFPKYDDLVEATEALLTLLEREGLEERYGEIYYSLMMAHHQHRHGDHVQAAEYGQTALMYAEAYGDEEDDFCKEIQSMLGVLEHAKAEL